MRTPGPMLARHRSAYQFIPYVAAEPFYESQYSKWSTTSLYAGSLFPLGKRVQFNIYFEHDNNTGKHSNRQVNSVGLVRNPVFLSTEEMNWKLF